MRNLFDAFITLYSALSYSSNLVTVAVYVLMGLALMWMGQQCGAKRPWLSWIPFARIWHLGLVAENCAAANGATPRKYRKILLGLTIATTTGAVVVGILVAVALVSVVLAGALSIANLPYYLENPSLLADLFGEQTIANLMASLLPIFIILALFALALAAISIIYTVFYFMALWQIFKLYMPQYAVLFLLLSIFVSPAGPIILLVLSRTRNPFAKASERTYETL